MSRLLPVVALLVVVSAAVAKGTVPVFAPVGTHYVATPDQRANLLIALNVYTNAGSPLNTVTYRDGSSVAAPDTTFTTPDNVYHNNSGWMHVTLTELGVPSNATSVDIGNKLVITKGGTEGDTYIALFGAPSGQGPTVCPSGYPAMNAYPTAANNGAPVNCMIALTIANLAFEGQRGFNTITVPVNQGGLDLAYDYQRTDGDTLGAAVYLNGYTT